MSSSHEHDDNHTKLTPSSQPSLSTTPVLQSPPLPADSSNIHDMISHHANESESKQISTSASPSSLLMRKSTPRKSSKSGRNQYHALRSTSTVSLLSENAVSVELSTSNTSPSHSIPSQSSWPTINDSPAKQSPSEDFENTNSSPQEQLLFQRLRRVSSASLKSQSSAISGISRRPSFFRSRDRSASNASRLSTSIGSNSMVSLSDVAAGTINTESVSPSYSVRELQLDDMDGSYIEQASFPISRRSSNASLKLISLKHRSSSFLASKSIHSKISTESLKSSLAPPITFRTQRSDHSSSLEIAHSANSRDYDTSDASFSFNSEFNFSTSIHLDDSADIPQDVGTNDNTSKPTLGQKYLIEDQFIEEDEEDENDKMTKDVSDDNQDNGDDEHDQEQPELDSPQTSVSDKSNQPQTPAEMIQAHEYSSSISKKDLLVTNENVISLPVPYQVEESEPLQEQNTITATNKLKPVVNFPVLQFPVLGHSTILCNSDSIRRNIILDSSSFANSVATNSDDDEYDFLNELDSEEDEDQDGVSNSNKDQSIPPSTSSDIPKSSEHNSWSELFDIALTKLIVEPYHRIDSIVKPYTLRLGQIFY